MSFQRRVSDTSGQGRSPNRGVLPYHEVERRPGYLLVIVPLLEGEAIWIGVTLNRADVVKAETGYGDSVVATELGTSADGRRTLCFDSVRRHLGARAIDYSSTPVARTLDEIGRASLKLALSNDEYETYLGVVLVTPALFSDVSGRPAPTPSSPEQSYGGWRMP